jgi:hypothetical protein
MSKYAKLALFGAFLAGAVTALVLQSYVLGLPAAALALAYGLEFFADL